MTTFAYRNGIMVSDTAVSGASVISAHKVKIAQRGPFFAGAAGSAVLAERFMDWFRSGMNGPCPDMFYNHGEPVEATGYIFGEDFGLRFESGGCHKAQAPYFAEGSGREFALGAMAAGATAEEAVRAACQHDIYSREPLTILRRTT